MSSIGEFDILEWIESGTVAQRSVVIYNDPAVAAEFETLQRRLDVAEKVKASGESSMGDRDEVAEILGQMDALYARWQASKATWVVQALSDERIRELIEEHPVPSRPEPIAEDADDDAKQGHAAAIKSWAEAFQVAQDERNLAFISAAIVRVETPKGNATSVSVEALRKMRKAPHGKARTEQLLAAVNAATQGDVEIPAPKSHEPSRTDRG